MLITLWKSGITLILLWLMLPFAVAQQRIISLAPHLTELVYEMKKQQQLVGTVERSDFPSAAKKITIIGNVYGLNLQKIHQLKPTLALVWQGTPAKHIALLQTLNISIFIDTAQRLSEINKMRLQLGALLSLSPFDIPQLQFPLLKKNQTLPKKVWYELWNEPLMTLGQKHWIHDIIKYCGLQTVATADITGSIRFSLLALKQEKIQPDLIITHQKSRLTFWKKQGYKAMWIDENYLTIPSSRLQYGINELCKIKSNE